MQNYREKVSAVNVVMKNKTSEYITKVLEFQAEFAKDLLEHAVMEQEVFEKKIQAQAAAGDVSDGDDSEEFNMQLELLGEKEAMLEMLTLTKDQMEAEIQA